MGSAAVQAPFVPVRRCSPPLRRPFLLLTLNSSHSSSVRSVRCSALTSPAVKVKSPRKKSLSKGSTKQSKRVHAVSLEAGPVSVSSSSQNTDLNYDEVAEQLENIYKLSPAKVVEKIGEGQDGEFGGMRLVRGKRRKAKRLSMEKRVAVKRTKNEERIVEDNYEGLLRENLVLWNLSGADWKMMKIPPVLKFAEQTKLFKLMQPMKAINELKESLRNDLQREPSDGELAAKINMTVPELGRHMKVGQAARNKLIKHNLRLVIYAINKHFAEFATNERFDDLCQAGMNGLITSIDRFEPKRGLRLSTYGLLWIRHSIIRSIPASSFTRYPHTFQSIKQEIQKAKLQLLFELGRTPTEEEIAKKVGITREKYQDIVKATRPVYSLNVKHRVTQEEFINGITDTYGFRGDKSRRQSPALLRLALDDVLDSLRPKENIVIRQRYGLDGKGERTLSEIAGNLNITKEMVRKYELKAFMKLKHPARLDYLRKYI
ncbi:RNA polymerase sigma factor rpoD [Rhynchospora pubera]|uniref:RNA polymerase sigma factor rpoD n=1 Tax=Rhynchospora pubera TaxID=906938 RepID=A0AAV8ANF8_9POAL|nr:RNA polymerase sigma factor rpoD [Rhynchospora pubera]KAJ4821292.1 RNA polymerase sigma factor rpoD [Rhynchospora pubera]